MANRESEEYTLHFIEQLGIKAKTLIYGKYAGIGRVVDTRHFDTYEVEGYGNFDQDNPDGYATGQCIDVLITKGVADRRRSFYRGEVVKDICSYGGDVMIIGKPQIGDIVGFRIGYYAEIWEKVDLSSPDICESEPGSGLGKISRETSLSSKVNLQLYRQASDLEEAKPDKALRIYGKLADGNSKFNLDIFFAGIIGFPIGLIVAFFGGKSIGLAEDSLALPFIWYSISLLIVMLFWAPRTSFKVKGKSLLWILIAAPMLAFAKILETVFGIFIVLLVAAVPAWLLYGVISVVHFFILGAPFVWLNPIDTSPAVYLPVSIICLALSFLFLVVFDVSIPKIPSIKLVFAVMKLKKNELLSILSMALALLMVTCFGSALGGQLDIFYDKFNEGIIFSVIAGILIGTAFARLDTDHLLANLFRLAKARCLIRMNRDFETYFPLRMTYEDLKILEPGAKYTKKEPLIKILLDVMLVINTNRERKNRKTLFRWAPWGVYIGSHEFHSSIRFRTKRVSRSNICKHINGAWDLVNFDSRYDEYRVVIVDSIRKTESLVALS